MRTPQISFGRGEIAPELRARVDLAFYNVALAKLKNMYVLPQGVVTRRPGFARLADFRTDDVTARDCPVRLVPFVYNAEDAMVIEFGNLRANVWRPSTGTIAASFATPYLAADLAELKYSQNGNMLFLTHRDYPIKTLTRKSLTEWELADFDFRKGPWADEPGRNEKPELYVSDYLIDSEQRCRVTISARGGDFFEPGDAGRLLALRYQAGNTYTDGLFAVTGTHYSQPLEVGGQWHLQVTSKTGDSAGWAGTILLQKSLDFGDNWITIRSYTRTGSWGGDVDFSGAETEEDVLYRVSATSTYSAEFRLDAMGYTREEIFRINQVAGPRLAAGEWIMNKNRNIYKPAIPTLNTHCNDWSIGAWGGSAGYPACSAFYQERFVLAGARESPRTLWFSRTAEYDNFDVTDPVSDEDAVTITLAGGDYDGIFNILAMTDILAFTSSGVWKISGYGDNGAIAPTAIVAHKQDETGVSRQVAPEVIEGAVITAQALRGEVLSLRYSFETDGYQASDISILARHMFAGAGRQIKQIAYQQVPDSLLWVLLDDGTAAVCTLQAEHEMIAWSRQETNGDIGAICCVPGERQTELWAAVRRGNAWGMERLAERAPEARFIDGEIYTYVSLLETLRVNVDAQGAFLTAKKYIPRVSVFALRSGPCRAAPKGDAVNEAGNLAYGERDRAVPLEYSEDVTETEIMLDNGFKRDAGIMLWTKGTEPLTILAISPVLASGS